MSGMPQHLQAYELELCIDDINRALGVTLAPGNAWFSSATHARTATKHATDYRIIMRHIGECCRAPTYIGRHKKHPDNVERILDIATDDGATHVLVAVIPGAGSLSTQIGFNARLDMVLEVAVLGPGHFLPADGRHGRHSNRRRDCTVRASMRPTQGLCSFCVMMKMLLTLGILSGIFTIRK